MNKSHNKNYKESEKKFREYEQYTECEPESLSINVQLFYIQTWATSALVTFTFHLESQATTVQKIELNQPLFFLRQKYVFTGKFRASLVSLSHWNGSIYGTVVK